ncbi:MAG: GNAT family N-acetyltransferase [Gaiellaceae bacterium]
MELEGYPATLRPVQPTDADALRRIRETPEVWQWWDEVEDDFPLGDDSESTRFTLLVDGEVAGLLQFWDESDPKYRHASVDLFLDPAYHGRGLGTAALRRLVRHLLEDRGHHRITIDPAVDNVAAIRSYEKVGFRPVGVMRSHERDAGGTGWHDSLLMGLLAEDLD